jgi:hypothetical protein
MYHLEYGRKKVLKQVLHASDIHGKIADSSKEGDRWIGRGGLEWLEDRYTQNGIDSAIPRAMPNIPCTRAGELLVSWR